MKAFRQLQHTATALSLLLVSACGASVAGLVEDRDATPGIVFESTGGIATLRVIVKLDSTTSVWSRATCSLSTSAQDCAAQGHVEQGTTSAAVRDRLFADARTDAFLRLPARFAATTTVADGMEHRLVISTAGFRRTIEWETGATLPALLEQFMTSLHAAVR